jgi:hypothetical protein
MACSDGTVVERQGSRVIAVQAFIAARALRSWQLLLIITAACSFDTQPIFDSRSDPTSDAGPGIGQQPLAQPDSGSARMDAGPPISIDCTPGELSCRDANTLLTCGPDGSPKNTESCASGCNERGAGVAACNVCMPGSVLGCSDLLSVRRCKADGSGEDNVLCPIGCSNGTCTGTCVPGATSCVDTGTLRTCDALGGMVDRACADGCNTSAGVAACRVCAPNSVICRGQDSVQCSANGQVATAVRCAHGCDAASGQCLSSRLLPSNLPAATCEAQAAGDVELSGSAALDTDTGCTDVVQQAGSAPEICVVRHRDIHVLPGAVITVTGSRALALVATRSLDIEGSISVAAHAGVAGPGGLASGAGVGRNGVGLGSSMVPDAIDTPANAGGGGGGHGVKGAAGGDAPGVCNGNSSCADPGAGGAVYGTEPLVPLQGGAQGGRNSAATASSRQATPGAGGGAIQLVSCADLTIGAQAAVEASGGGGGGGFPGTTDASNDTPGAGAGGGSGGAILIEAVRVAVQRGAILVANGGGGGGGAVRAVTSGGSNGGGMPMTRAAAPGLAGQDGRRSGIAAAGGQPGGTGSLPGGAGGTANPPTPGGTSTQPEDAAGGGGGAAGRIRVNTQATPVDLTGIVVSPRATTGVAASG